MPLEIQRESPEAAKKSCFVIGPIGADVSDERRHADILFHDVLQPALSDEFHLLRADHMPQPGSINEQVINAILDADLIVADMSFRNPNAFYELGIADSHQKPVILFIRKADPLPFDKASDRIIRADIDWWQEKNDAKKRIQSSVASMSDKGFSVTNPVTQARGVKKLAESADSERQIVAQLAREVAELRRQREYKYENPEDNPKYKIVKVDNLAKYGQYIRGIRDEDVISHMKIWKEDDEKED